jgi:hypothetical protein
MALTTRTLPALMNGISQQPAILRSPDQTEDELNTWSHISEGLSRRPPTETVMKLTALTAGDTYSVHHINRDINERYLVIIKSGTILVYDETTGVQKTVNAPQGYGYLDAAGDSYRAMSIADYTFIVNTTKTVVLKPAEADQDPANNPNGRWLGGTSPSNYDVPPGGFVLAGAIFGYRPNPTQPGGFVGTVPSMDKLPDPPCSGCVYKVLGQNDTAFVSYYVMGDGTLWNETVKPGLQNAIDETTMPWALIREADGTFTFAPFSWQHRRVGDEESNPAPPFVGRTIRDIFFYQNRLAFAVDDGVVFSAAGDPGDFWRRTVLDYIDSDTVAASAATTDVAILDYTLPFADGVMLFSRQKQLSLSNGDAGLSAHSLSIVPVTNYVMAAGVRPTPMGSQAHFLSEARGYVAVQEYTRLAGSDPTEAADITAHVPHLIPKGVSQIIPFHDLDALLILSHKAATTAAKKKAYVYQFFWDGDKKLVSAWRVWDFGDGTPVTGAYESGNLYLVMERPDGVYLEKMDLSPEALTTNQTHRIYLDRQVSVTGTYNAVADTTAFNLGWTPDLSTLEIVQAVGSAFPENIVNHVGWSKTGTTVTVNGNYAGPATAGQLYTTKVTISRQFPNDWQNRPLTTGRLQLHTFTANLTGTAYLRAEVYPYGTGPQALDADLISKIEFSPRKVGDVASILGARSYADGPFTFSVAGDAAQVRIDLINDTAFNSTLTSAEWEGIYFSRAL